MSYTTFNYKDIVVDGRNIKAKITNTGKLAGKEVAQLYVGFPEKSGEPPKLLKGFQKVSLEPGETKEVKFTLRDRDLSIYDVPSHSW